jgi:predicted porin
MKKSALAIAVAMTAAATANAAPSMEEMWQIIQQQQAEIERLKGQQTKTDEKLQETEVKVEATADAVAEVSTGAVAKVAEWANNTQVGGYGEHHFNNFKNKDDQVDAHRFVLFVNHQFSDTVRLFTELEVEHGLVKDTSCDGKTPTTGTPLDCGDKNGGEVELEQAYIEWDFTENHSLHIGQFLIPVGILNETHEPDTFYGTERNNVEKYIVPTTWWETGVQVVGEIAPGLSYNAGIHSGLEMSATEGVRKGRQKSANATAEDLAATARLKYTGIAGLELAGTVQYQQDVSQGNDGLTEDADAILLEAHAVYRTGDFGLRALWASWDIDNDTFETNGTDEQEGWYIEPSYKLTEKLGIFARYSEWDSVAGGNGTSDEIVQWDYGINYWLTPRVVLKADITEQQDVTKSKSLDSFNLGVGWSF